jgi:hypothetical protein
MVCKTVGSAGETTHRRVVREISLGTIEAIREATDAPVRVAVEAYNDPEGGSTRRRSG